MMNIPLLPASTGIDTLGAYAIIALVADPQAAKKRLDELTAEKQAGLDALAAARDEREKAEAATAAVAQAQTETEAARRAAEANVQARKELDARAADLTKRDADLKAAQTRFDQALVERGVQWDAREQAVLAREVAAEAREKRIATQEAALAAREADYQRKVGKLRELAG